MAGSLNADIIARAVYQEDRKVAEDKRREFFRANKVSRPQKKSRWRSGVCKLCNGKPLRLFGFLLFFTKYARDAVSAEQIAKLL